MLGVPIIGLLNFMIWFKPTGWRPDDVNEKYPIKIVDDPYSMKKYDTKASPQLHTWSWIQYGISTVFLLIMLVNFASLGMQNIMLMGVFLLVSIYSYSTLMDRDSYAIWIETLKSIAGLFIIYSSGDWFGINQLVPLGSLMVAGYFVASIFIVGYFVFIQFKEENKVALA